MIKITNKKSEKRSSQISYWWLRFRRHRLGVLGLVSLHMLAFLAVFAPWIAPYNPLTVDLYAVNQPPTLHHLLGTDRSGRDVLSRLIWGSRISLSVGFVAVSIQITLGTVLGLLSGFKGGIWDFIIQRIVETVLSFPVLIIIIAIAAILGPSIYNTMLILGLIGWTGVCRMVRGEVLSRREEIYVEAARAIGASSWHIMIRHILPNVLPPIVVAASFGLAGAILSEATLSFLGLGVPPPVPSWGAMLRDAQSLSVLASSPWLWAPPGLLISLAVLSINFLGDALQDIVSGQREQL